MWIQDIENALATLQTEVNVYSTLISHIALEDRFIVFTSTSGKRYYYNIHDGDILIEEEIADLYTTKDLGHN